MKLNLTIDGEKIPTNGFVESIISNIIIAAVGSLHGVNGNWKDISIELHREE